MWCCCLQRIFITTRPLSCNIPHIKYPWYVSENTKSSTTARLKLARECASMRESRYLFGLQALNVIFSYLTIYFHWFACKDFVASLVLCFYTNFSSFKNMQWSLSRVFTLSCYITSFYVFTSDLLTVAIFVVIYIHTCEFLRLLSTWVYTHGIVT